MTQDALHAGRPDHAGRMELDELHVHQLGAGMVGERMSVAGAFPAVARDLERAPAPPVASTTADGVEHLESSALALVADDADRPAVGDQQAHDGEFHVDGDAAVDAVILQRPDHLETGAVADVRQPRIAVAAEVALEDPAVGRPIEDGAPGFELAHAIGRLSGVELGHAPVVDVLAAAHRVGEVHLPAVAIVDVGEGGGDAPFSHDGVRLAEQRFADQPDLDAGRRGFDRRAQAGAAGADHENVVFVCLVVHESGCVSVRATGRGAPDLQVADRARASQDPEVRPDAHRAQAHVEVGEPDGEQAAPREQLVTAIQAGDARVTAPSHAPTSRSHRGRRQSDAAASGS